MLSRDLRVVTVAEEDSTSLAAELRTIKVIDLAVPEGENPPVFAPTKDKLRQRLEELHPPPSPSADADLPQALRDKAPLIGRKYQAIVGLLPKKKDKADKPGKAFPHTNPLPELVPAQ